LRPCDRFPSARGWPLPRPDSRNARRIVAPVSPGKLSP
jgi:hypothetical protein